jgi:superfamily I DNA/RNA helicase
MKNFENNEYILSDEQIKAKESEAEWTLITGHGGTGKTIALLEKALWLLEKEKKNDPDDKSRKVVFISGTMNKEYEYFKGLVENNFAEYGEMFRFCTKTGFLRQFLPDKYDGEYPTYNYSRKNPKVQENIDELDKKFSNWLEMNIIEKCDHILIDEAQDFSFAELYIISKLAVSSLTLVASSAQDVFYKKYDEYSRNSSKVNDYHEWDLIKYLLEYHSHGMKFKEIKLEKQQFRCTEAISKFANSIVSSKEIGSDLKFRAAGNKPVLNICRNEAHEYSLLGSRIAKVINETESDAHYLSNVAVLTIKKNDVDLVIKNLNDCGYSYDDRSDVVISNTVVVKGIEFKHVFIVLERMYNQNSSIMCKNLYTAVTRATDHVELFICEDKKDYYVNKLGLNTDYYDVPDLT